MSLSRTVIFLVLFGVARVGVADSEAMPRPVVFVSPGGSHYLRLIPSADFDESNAEGFLYRVSAEADELLYKTKAWYAFTVLVSNDGKSLVRSGPWPRFGSPPEQTPALVFYTEGKQSRVYFVSDLVGDLSTLERSISHYSWGGGLEWSNRGWDNLVQVRTVEGQTLVFNIETAEIVQ